MYFCGKQRNTPFGPIYESEPEGIRAYRVVITGHRDGAAIGNVFPLHYREQVQRIQQAALPVATVEITYTT